MPDVRCFPEDDRDFAVLVRAAIEEADPDDPVTLTDALADIQLSYPNARLVRRSDLASMPGAEPLLYAYRDGSLVPGEVP